MAVSFLSVCSDLSIYFVKPCNVSCHWSVHCILITKINKIKYNKYNDQKN